MGAMKEIHQQIQELGMVKWDLSQGTNYFVEWADDDKKCRIMITQHLEVFWEVEAGDKLYDGQATTPFNAVEAINTCISDNALGTTIGNEDQ